MKFRYAVKRFFSSNNKMLLLIIIAVVVAIFSISYALFTTTLESKGSLNIITGQLPSKLISSQLDVDNEVVVAPNETKVLVIDIKNTNSISAKYNLYYSLSKANGNIEIKYLASSNVASTEGVTIPANTAVTVKIRVVNNDTENIVITFGSKGGLINDNLTYPSGMTLVSEEKLPLCKRATNLHSEVCSQSSGYCADDEYARNAQITYGNETTTAGTLTTGDAFDCDVNGDGLYDNINERFYYVSTATDGVDSNENVGVLIYSNNVKEGVASTLGGAYALQADTNGTERNENFHGPLTAMKDLPKLTGDNAWSNAPLVVTSRAIKNELSTNDSDEVILPGGDETHQKISFEGYAARLLTYQEVQTGCYDGETEVDNDSGLSTKCKFLFENTKYSKSTNQTYGTWLETVDSADTTKAWNIASDLRGISEDNVSRTSFRGIRPAIEVALTYIEK